MIRIADNRRFDVPDVSYDFGGCRLALDPQGGTLFSGAYYRTGIAAYDVETGNQLWHRRDLKKLQSIAFDERNELVYCAFEDGASRPLNVRDGRERRAIRGLEAFYFSKNSDLAVFEYDEIKLEDREAGVSHVLPRETWGIIAVAFAGDAVVLSWVDGPVVSYDAKTGHERWRYTTEGTHAFSIAPAYEEASVWLAEQPYQEPPWHRLRLVTGQGEIKREIRCALGHSFELLPFCDKVIIADMTIVPIDTLERS